MKKLSLLVFGLLISIGVFAQSTYVKFATNKGNITVMLYDQTPKHKAMFLHAIKKGVYKNAQFNRVIKDFVSQAGELDEPILAREKLHPEQTPVRLAGEFNPLLFHKKGVLAAGRDDNPAKSSYYNQIYFVAGKLYDDQKLDALEQKKGHKFQEEIRKVYKTIGGTPSLDMDYT
ncbi:MAG: peptidylprolyl isomerase, partial [Pedobacter sp.]